MPTTNHRPDRYYITRKKIPKVSKTCGLKACEFRGHSPEPKRIPRHRSVRDRPPRANLLPPETLLLHVPLHERLVRGKVASVPDSLAPERRHLALEDAADALGGVQLADAVERTGVAEGEGGGLSLQT